MELKGFYDEDTLIELLQEGKISILQFVWNQSAERRKDYLDFCSNKNLEKGEASARLFMQYVTEEETYGD